MDELVHHCLRELAFDGDLGASFYVIFRGPAVRTRPRHGILAVSGLANLRFFFS